MRNASAIQLGTLRPERSTLVFPRNDATRAVAASRMLVLVRCSARRARWLARRPVCVSNAIFAASSGPIDLLQRLSTAPDGEPRAEKHPGMWARRVDRPAHRRHNLCGWLANGVLFAYHLHEPWV
jgi:hypothetical protein